MEGFTFFRSYFESIDQLPEEYQLQSYRNIFYYIFKDEQPTAPGVESAIFAAMKPNLDKSVAKSKSGSTPNGKPGSNRIEQNQNAIETDRIASDRIKPDQTGSNEIKSESNGIESDQTPIETDRSGSKRIEQNQMPIEPDRNGSNDIEPDQTASKRIESESKRIERPTVTVTVTDTVKDTETETIKDQNPLCAEGEDQAGSRREANEVFERLWKLYPNKRGKGQISDAKKKTILGIGEEHMTRAVKRYIDEHEEKERSGAFTPRWQNGSTFFNSGYVDYLDENYQPSPHEPSRMPRGPSMRQQADAQPEVAYDENGRAWPVIGGIDWSKV